VHEFDLLGTRDVIGQAKEKMIETTPACVTWCTERRICSWSYWLSTSSSTVISFSFVHARL